LTADPAKTSPEVGASDQRTRWHEVRLLRGELLSAAKASRNSFSRFQDQKVLVVAVTATS